MLEQDMGPSRTGSTQKRRRAANLKHLPRSAAGSHLFRAAEVVAPPNRPPESKFSPSALGVWMLSYLPYVFRRKHEFPPASRSPQNAIYDLGGDDGSDVRVALAGDWATGTKEADSVASQMKSTNPHFTIHLADIYYVGDPPEINENCLGILNPNNNYDPVKWPIGSRGSFALNGNHEMYANGDGYFDVFLPRLGLKNASGNMLGQQTSFFCLQNRFWRIIAIDTGYNSPGVPILSQIPGVNLIPGISGNCRLEEDLIEWVTDTVAPERDQRGIIILSHHQYYSAFQNGYRKPAQQLAQAGINRPVIWFWGHEHRLAGYDLSGRDDLKAYGRCVGHGGMPVDLMHGGQKLHEPSPVFFDERHSPNGFGFNGHANLSFVGNSLKVTYVDLVGTPLLTESWLVDGAGSLKVTKQVQLIEDRDFHFRPAGKTNSART